MTPSTPATAPTRRPIRDSIDGGTVAWAAVTGCAIGWIMGAWMGLSIGWAS